MDVRSIVRGRGDAPAVEPDTEVKIATPGALNRIVELARAPYLDEIFDNVAEVLTGEEIQVPRSHHMESGRGKYFLFYENPVASIRAGYEHLVIRDGGILGGRPYEDLQVALGEAKHTAAVLLSKLPERGGLFVLTSPDLYDRVSQTFKELGCKVSDADKVPEL